jgi:hypothetical protein
MKRYLSRFLSVCIVVIASLQLLSAQSVEYDPVRNPFYNRTVVGFYTTIPPDIDAIIDDYCWVRPATAPTAITGGAGYNSIDFPANQNITLPINVSDNGTLSGGPPPPPNTYTDSYPTSAGSFGLSWDLEFVYFAVKIVNQAAADLTN